MGKSASQRSKTVFCLTIVITFEMVLNKNWKWELINPLPFFPSSVHIPFVTN